MRNTKPSQSIKAGESADTLNQMRLNKYLAECGVASRRGADDLIVAGAVQINGKKVYELGARVDVKNDRVVVDGKPVRLETRKLYMLFNKPKGVMTTMEDPEGRPCIAEYFERIDSRVFPVGRLDYDSEGLLLMTNDGDFAQRVTHPKHEVLKTYLVKVSGHPTEEQIRKLRMGVTIVGGRVAARELEKLRGTNSDKYDWFKIVIGEGKNRQIRQMFEKIGFDVMKLQRIAIGKLKMGGLARGEWVLLGPEEIEKIFQRDTDRLLSGGRAVKRESGKHGAPKSAKAKARDESSRRKGQSLSQPSARKPASRKPTSRKPATRAADKGSRPSLASKRR